ncbi:hypothetical protein BR93DRAFT_924168 [Coniochaeta sp. PMI_546]|nr:hypothetical protein BR93DRAFT_924168 [Coniochaeta sp. PMI_546]
MSGASIGPVTESQRSTSEASEESSRSPATWPQHSPLAAIPEASASPEQSSSSRSNNLEEAADDSESDEIEYKETQSPPQDIQGAHLRPRFLQNFRIPPPFVMPANFVVPHDFARQPLASEPNQTSEVPMPPNNRASRPGRSNLPSQLPPQQYQQPVRPPQHRIMSPRIPASVQPPRLITPAEATALVQSVRAMRPHLTDVEGQVLYHMLEGSPYDEAAVSEPQPGQTASPGHESEPSRRPGQKRGNDDDDDEEEEEQHERSKRRRMQPPPSGPAAQAAAGQSIAPAPQPPPRRWRSRPRDSTTQNTRGGARGDARGGAHGGARGGQQIQPPGPSPLAQPPPPINNHDFPPYAPNPHPWSRYFRPQPVQTRAPASWYIPNAPAQLGQHHIPHAGPSLPLAHAAGPSFSARQHVRNQPVYSQGQQPAQPQQFGQFLQQSGGRVSQANQPQQQQYRQPQHLNRFGAPAPGQYQGPNQGNRPGNGFGWDGHYSPPGDSPPGSEDDVEKSGIAGLAIVRKPAGVQKHTVRRSGWRSGAGKSKSADLGKVSGGRVEEGGDRKRVRVC